MSVNGYSARTVETVWTPGDRTTASALRDSGECSVISQVLQHVQILEMTKFIL